MARGIDTGPDPRRQVARNALTANKLINTFQGMGYETVHDGPTGVYMRAPAKFNRGDMGGFYANRETGKTFTFNASQPHNLDAKLAGPDYKGPLQDFWDDSQGPEGGDVWSQRFQNPGQGPTYGPGY